MIRNLKVLGTVLVAVVAMSAVVASGAQATLKITVPSAPAVLTGEPIQHEAGEVAPFRHSFITSGGVALACLKTQFVGTVTSTATENTTIIPSYTECHALISGKTYPATITMEDCDYLLHGGVVEAGSSTTFEKAELDVVCPAGKTVVIHIYETAAKHTNNEATCTLTVPPFVNGSFNTYHNVAGSPDDITITTTVAVPAVQRHGSILCGLANQTATYTGSTTLRAYEDMGSATPSNGTLSEVKEGNQINVTMSE